MNLNTKETLTRLNNVLDCLRRLSGATVRVGLPPAAPSRSRFLLALHERGSPLMRIPPRPVLTPALSAPETVSAMTAAMTAAAGAASRGDRPGVEAALRGAGQAGADGIRAYIDAGISPGNAPVTVSGGWVRNPVAKKNVPVRGKGFDKPLYDTGALYRSFGYVIETKE